MFNFHNASSLNHFTTVAKLVSLKEFVITKNEFIFLYISEYRAGYK